MSPISIPNEKLTCKALKKCYCSEKGQQYLNDCYHIIMRSVHTQMLSKNGEEVYSDAEYARQGRMTASTGAAARSGAVSKAGARCSEDNGDDGQPDWWKRKSNSADSEADVFKKMVSCPSGSAT